MIGNVLGRVFRKQKRRGDYYFDYALLFVVLVLIGFGLVMIYSASSYSARVEFGDASHYLTRQFIAVAIGMVAMLFVSIIPYQVWRRFYIIAYGVSFVLIPMVLTPLGIESHNARRWIGIPGTGFNLQPAEVAKIATILVAAVLVVKLGKDIETLKGAAWMMIPPAILAVMIWLITDNMSSAIIVMGIAFVMYFVAHPKYKWFLVLGLVAAVFVAILILIVFKTDWLTGFRAERILAWRDPEKYAQGKGFQTLQALYAIGSGGAIGKGLGQSMQKLNFLPESQNDMIFSIICEELGLAGAIIVIALFAFLIWRMMVVANNAPDLFGGMLVVGVLAHIAIQVILNIAVVTNTIPNTGISLPFISYGGSSVIFLMAEIGLVLNVAKSIELRDE